MNSRSPIAVVGMGCVVPGARGLDQFWRNIVNKVDCSREVPSGRWALPAELALSHGVEPDRVQSLRGCFVDDFDLDCTGLRVESAWINRLDHAFRIAIDAGRQAWMDGKTSGLDPRRVGVILAAIALPTAGASTITQNLLGGVVKDRIAEAVGANFTNRPIPENEPLDINVTGLPAELIARALGLGGPAYTLDAACASSLYALKLACDELAEGRADTMLAGGLSRPDCLFTQMGFTQLRALSPTGKCAPFDHGSNGLLVGEGAGLLLLKRLEDAIRVDDRIYGVIRGIGISNDIGGSLLAPDSEGQLRAMRSAYEQAGLRPNDVDLIECHGTGTPAGDAVEIASLRTLWNSVSGAPGRCAIGSVKSMVGHLLTAAGAAGIIKTLLAMREATLPPSLNYRRAAKTLESSPFSVQIDPSPWRRRDPPTPRRAAISAFGFGGINAHVLVEEFQRGDKIEIASPQSSSLKPQALDVAIVGMDARFGRLRSLREFESTIFNGSSAIEPVDAGRLFGLDSESSGYTRSNGASITSVEVSVGKYRLPPAELPSVSGQQIVMLESVAAALASAGMPFHERRPRTGVIIGMSFDMDAANFSLRWWVEANLPKWLRDAGLELGDGEFAALLAASKEAAGPTLDAPRVLGNLGGMVASRIARECQFGGPSFGVSSGDASGIRALEIAARSLARGEMDSVVVGAVDMACDLRRAWADQNADQAARQYADGGCAVVLKRLHDAQRDGDRIFAVIRGFEADVTVDCLEQSSESLEKTIGSAGAASGLAAVVKAALCLHRELLPAVVPSEKVQVFPGPSHWYRNADDGPRRAAVSAEDLSGNSSSVVLQEHSISGSVDRCVERRTALFVIESEHLQGLARRAEALEQIAGEDIDRAARKWLALHPLDQRFPLAVAIVAESGEELKSALSLVMSAVRSGDLVSLEGVPKISHASRPMGGSGKLAFVYPGAGNHFVGMGRELAVHFPQVSQAFERECRRSYDQMMPNWFTPRCDESENWREAAESAMSSDMRRMIFGQVAYCVLASDVIRSLGIEPNAVIGYSLGESAALFAMRAWPDRDEMLDRMFRSPLFSTQLAGPRTALQESWGIGPDDAATWKVVVIPRTTAEVREALVGLAHARLLIVNTPKECVVGGLAADVDQVAKRLKCRAIPLEHVPTVHCDAMQSVHADYQSFHMMRTTPPQGIRFYSGMRTASYDVTAESAAGAISGHALHGFDFPAVIDKAYGDGVRVFVEVGPQGSCTRMIRKILSDRPHVALTASSCSESEWTSMLKMVAALIAHRVPVDLRRVYPSIAAYDESTGRIDQGATVTVPIGGRLGWPKVACPARCSTANLPKEAARHLETSLARESDAISIAPRINEPALAMAEAHNAFLRFSDAASQGLASALAIQSALLERVLKSGNAPVHLSKPKPAKPKTDTAPAVDFAAVKFDRAACLEFARGKVARILGTDFAVIDGYPVRVRLPDEPLMLVDRILRIEGEKRSLTAGRIVTEHDVHHDAWYLDGDRAPICITVESGQADLFLSSYLGIDFVAQGKRAYRLLDATVTFLRGLPRPGETIRYDIRIDRFVRQGDTYLFFFEFDGTIRGEPVLTMRKGCAGFFTREEIQNSHGIVLSAEDQASQPPQVFDWPLDASPASFDDRALAALRRGDLAGCFGKQFTGLSLNDAPRLPDGRMKLIDRVLTLEPRGGRFGLGRIVGEADIHPDDWFLTCHFVDDMVMPGTLMYECCVHTLRFFLTRMGWVAEADSYCYEPIPGRSSALRCRGPVTPATRKATYEIEIKEVGFRPEPYVIADALMSADGKRIVQMRDMSLQLTGLTREMIDAVWKAGSVSHEPSSARPRRQFTREQILAFAIGNPSECFGERYRVFDGQRRIARLPGPPYQFLDRVTRIDHPPFELSPTDWIEAEYDVPRDAWYFAANRQPTMPFAVLLEIALQPCGFLAAYCGSALTSSTDLSFRNLGGHAVLREEIWPDIGTLRTRVRMTDVSQAGGMIIEKFQMQVLSSDRVIYDGDTSFGFFSAAALAQQVGIRDAGERFLRPDVQAAGSFSPVIIPDRSPLPDQSFRMVSRVDCLLPDGGPNQLGFIRGSIDVDPSAWFFKAHFYQDPVWPGSLGLEALLQLLKVHALARRPDLAKSHRFEAMATSQRHDWIYRGQVIPRNKRVEVQAVITGREDSARPLILADGFLTVDGVTIYEMKDFGIRLIENG